MAAINDAVHRRCERLSNRYQLRLEHLMVVPDIESRQEMHLVGGALQAVRDTFERQGTMILGDQGASAGQKDMRVFP